MAIIISHPQAVNVGSSQSLKSFSYTSLTKRTSCVLQQKNYGNYNKRKTNRLTADVKLHFASSCLKDDSFSHIDSSSISPTEMMERFYKCINEKNLKELDNYISEACLIDDSLFDEPFIRKKEAMSYFEKLTQSMGPDVKFRIHNICERGISSAGAIWHLEWKNMKIPFTEGCTFIDIMNEEEGKTIQKAQIMVEPLVKAGNLILAIMKIVTLLRTKYPAIHEWLKKVSQQRWVKWMSKICIIPFKFLWWILKTNLKLQIFTYFGSRLFSYITDIVRYKVLQEINTSPNLTKVWSWVKTWTWTSNIIKAWSWTSYITKAWSWTSYITKPLSWTSYITKPLSWTSYITKPLSWTSYIIKPWSWKW